MQGIKLEVLGSLLVWDRYWNFNINSKVDYSAEIVCLNLVK